MATLKELRDRVSSVRSTRKITQAMRMVAAAKLRRAQDAAERARPFAEGLEVLMGKVAPGVLSTGTAPLLLRGGEGEVHWVVAVTSDRGLCGGFNASVVKAAREKARELEAGGGEVKFLCVGRKGRDMLSRLEKGRVLGLEGAAWSSEPSAEGATALSKFLREALEGEEFATCWLVYGKFRSVLSQEPTAVRVIPSSWGGTGVGDTGGGDAGGVEERHEFEPDEQEAMEVLAPMHLTAQAMRGLLENAASEQGARMTAMDSATRNAGEMIDRLTLLYNRTRQAKITTELVEIVSGAEAL